MDREKSSQVVRVDRQTRLSSSGAFEERTRSAPRVDWRPGDLIARKYEVVRKVASGGMGAVYAVRHLDLGKVVALKVMLTDGVQSARDVERFRREAKAAARMSSERIVRVYDVDSTDTGVPYLVMDLLEGVPLSRAIEQGYAFSQTRAVEYIVQLCDAIEEAHRHGVIHRDIKPSNLMACGETLEKPATGNAQSHVSLKLLDFGAAKFKDEPAPAPENGRDPRAGFYGLPVSASGDFTVFNKAMVPGTPAYMSPEQYLQPNEITGAVDIWAAGVVLFELIVGKPPFEGNDVAALAEAIVLDPPPLHAISCPPLRAIVARCLEKKPAQRYASAAELRSDLVAFLNDKRAGQPDGFALLQDEVRPRKSWRRKLAAAAALAASAAGIWIVVAAPGVDSSKLPRHVSTQPPARPEVSNGPKAVERSLLIQDKERQKAMVPDHEAARDVTAIRSLGKATSKDVPAPRKSKSIRLPLF
jgi:eukaryotic-like serine/threonine-protein kinase